MDQARFRGALLGMAAGDALGTTLEFQPPGSFEPLDDMVGGGPFRLKVGEWTDDTSMGLCLAESLISQRGFNPVHQLETYCRWHDHGHLSSNGRCFDIGVTTVRALRHFKANRLANSGTTDPQSAGNGSIMRLAAVPMFYANDPAEAIRRSGESSRTTHGAVSCVEACRYLGGLIVGALQGVPKLQLLANEYEPAVTEWRREPFQSEVAAVAAGSFKHKEPPSIAGTGYVVKSLEAALWAFYRTDNFRDGALLAVNLGDDADTTGAVYGQFAGAYYGAEGIPERWRSLLAKHDLIVQFADQLYELAIQFNG